MKSLALALSLLIAAPLAASAVDFKTEILPIFESRCFKCHGNGESKGSFSLDPDEIKKHIRSSGQISPGRSDRSMLMELITTDDSDDRMPRNGAALSADQIELIKTWINDGANIGDGSPDDEKKEEAGGMAKPASIKGSWTNREGKAIEATLVKVEGANAVLVLADGRSVPYPIANLSDESQEKVKAFVEASKPKE
ncbi:MAG: hypothetical protein KDN20_10275 [Verrucomicrobiae bacterium]|nr:hypothetical protein [Verrucomicrobiae bacterium]